jgi:hypothetical protein
VNNKGPLIQDPRLNPTPLFEEKEKTSDEKESDRKKLELAIKEQQK